MPALSCRRAALALCLSAAPLGVVAADDQVVATVDGVAITIADIVAVKGDLPPQYQALPAEALYDGIRQQLIDQTLLAAAAEAAALPADPAVARALAIQRAGLLAQYYMRAEIGARVTEDALRAAYAEQIGAAPAVEEVRASHILVETEEAATDLRAQIDAGADFAGLAIEHGTDGTRLQGGDLGYFTREVMVPEFADAAFAMTVGEISQPVQTQFGWHLINLTDRREQPKPAFEDVRAELEGQVGSQVAQQILADLRAAAAIETPQDRPGIDAMRP